ncbi:MAG: class I SAM-dependent methyltransferase [Bacillota bacterium]
MADKINKSYKQSVGIYDSILTQSSFIGKLYMGLFWGGIDDVKIADELLARIPDDFSGTILDVPVGTAIFTYEKWSKLKNAKLICLDYSEDMLEKAKLRLGEHEHISCVQGDVGNLSFDDESCDIVCSMNGFHAFPDTKKAFHEVHRVLKKDGMFVACFYIKDKSKISDWLVNAILSKKGWFTPPFHTDEEVKEILSQSYHDIELKIEGSMIYFWCRKK